MIYIGTSCADRLPCRRFCDAYRHLMGGFLFTSGQLNKMISPSAFYHRQEAEKMPSKAGMSSYPGCSPDYHQNQRNSKTPRTAKCSTGITTCLPQASWKNSREKQQPLWVWKLLPGQARAARVQAWKSFAPAGRDQIGISKLNVGKSRIFLPKTSSDFQAPGPLDRPSHSILNPTCHTTHRTHGCI
jgi:hypothetical protein